MLAPLPLSPPPSRSAAIAKVPIANATTSSYATTAKFLSFLRKVIPKVHPVKIMIFFSFDIPENQSIPLDKYLFGDTRPNVFRPSSRRRPPGISEGVERRSNFLSFFFFFLLHGRGRARRRRRRRRGFTIGARIKGGRGPKEEDGWYAN